MRSKLFASMLAIGLGLATPVVGAIVCSNRAIAEMNSSEFDHVFAEGMQLYNEGSTESLRKAIFRFTEAIRLAQIKNEKLNQALGFLALGRIYEHFGETKKTLDHYNQSLQISQSVGDRYGEARSINNIGFLYSNLGEKQKALDYYNKSLLLFRIVNDRGGEEKTLNNIGLLYSNLGDNTKALDYYNQSLKISRAIENQFGELKILNNIASVYSKLGEKRKGLDYYNQSLLIIRSIGDRSSEATALNNIGLVYSDLGEKQKALEYYSQALPILRAVGNRSIEATTLNNIGYILASQQQSEMAIVFFKQSVSIKQFIRKNIYKFPQETQESYTQTVAHTYRNLADLLLQENRTIEALQVLDLLKVQDLQDFLKDTKGNDRTRKGVELFPEEEAILTAFNDSSSDLNTFLKSSIVQTQSQLLKANAAKQNLQLNAYKDLQTRINKLGKKVALFYPLILDDRLELVVITNDRPPIHKPIAIPKQQLETEIETFRQQLQGRSSRIKEPAQKLYQRLIQPIEAELKAAGVTTIVYAPDGIMRYVPLAALHDGTQWLAERYQINYLTALALTPLDPPTPQPTKLLAGAATKPYTVSTLGTTYHFSGLKFTQPEIEGIATTVSQSKLLIDRDFTRTAIEAQMPQYNLLHFATHATFVSSSPDASFVLLGDGSTLSIRELEQWKLPQVSLVVLSACETAIGGKLGNGIEILGFGYQTQRTGARASVSSLWRVDDGGTQGLMNQFYTSLNQGNTPALAIQKAQKHFISGNVNFNQNANQKREADIEPSVDPDRPMNLSHPYYWAPFILIGNGL